MRSRIFIGIPVLNRPDLLETCVRSLDYPSQVVVINNNSTCRELRASLDSMAIRYGLDVLHQERNLGVAASWNALIHYGFDQGHEWIFIGSNDTFLHAGSLRAAVELPKHPSVAVWHLHAFNFFLLRRKTIDLVGWFDENFYPAYKEDQDYAYRCQLAGLSRLPVIPGCSAEHVGSATIHSDPEMFALNMRTHQMNAEYYLRKWGGDYGHEVFLNPYSDPQHDHKWWCPPVAAIEHDVSRASQEAPRA